MAGESDNLNSSRDDDFVPAELTSKDVAGMEKFFGTTDDVRDAYFIMPDGKWLDFSGISDSECHKYSFWGPEHPLIGLYYGCGPSTLIRDAVVRLGMIRVIADSNSSLMEIGTEPNQAQYEGIKQFLDELTDVMYDGEAHALREEDDPRLIVEICHGKFSKTYNVDELPSVIPDIKKVFAGETPRERSIVQMFHESSDDDIRKAIVESVVRNMTSHLIDTL